MPWSATPGAHEACRAWCSSKHTRVPLTRAARIHKMTGTQQAGTDYKRASLGPAAEQSRHVPNPHKVQT